MRVCVSLFDVFEKISNCRLQFLLDHHGNGDSGDRLSQTGEKKQLKMETTIAYTWFRNYYVSYAFV